MNYYQQRLKEHVDAYWAITDPDFKAMRYEVDDETGHIEVNTEYHITELHVTSVGGGMYMQFFIQGFMPASSNKVDKFNAVVFPISELTFLVAIGAV